MAKLYIGPQEGLVKETSKDVSSLVVLPQSKEIVYVDRPVETIVEKIVIEETIQYVDRPVEIIKEVVIEVPTIQLVEKEVIKYVDREVQVEKIVRVPVIEERIIEIPKIIHKEVVPIGYKVMVVVEAVFALIVLLIK